MNILSLKTSSVPIIQILDQTSIITDTAIAADHSHTKSMFISEIYESRQGEGIFTGTMSVFVRTSGCNLRCQFCDTPFTSWDPEGKSQDVREIVKEMTRYSSRHVVITGGEPMMAKGLEEFTRTLREMGWHITIETAGTLFRDVDCDLMSISPKLSNSTPSEERAGNWAQRHERTRLNVEVVGQLMELCDYQLKFVVADKDDLAEIESFLSRLTTFARERVLLMPEGVDIFTLEKKAEWLEPLCREKGFAFCQRQHIFWYGNKRGT